MESEDMNSDDDVFEVEKIVDDVIVGGKTYYRVRWKNYGEAGDTWEPRDNLLSCEDLLNNYIRAQTEKSTGLTLSSDVFTAGGTENDSESDSGKLEDRKKGKVGRKKNAEKEKLKTSSKTLEDSSSSSSDEPQVKDDFWEKLKEGKIDVFASDLYSKVKQRRPPEKGAEEQHHDLPTEITGKGKKRGPKKKGQDEDQKEDLEDFTMKAKKTAGRKLKTTSIKRIESDDPDDDDEDQKEHKDSDNSPIRVRKKLGRKSKNTAAKVVESDLDDDHQDRKEEEASGDPLIKMKKKPGRKSKNRPTKSLESDIDEDDDNQKERKESDDRSLKVKKKPGRKPKNIATKDESDLDDDEDRKKKEDDADHPIKVKKKPGRKPKSISTKPMESDLDHDDRDQMEKEGSGDNPSKMKKKPGRKTKDAVIELDESDSNDDDQKEKHRSENFPSKMRKKPGRKPKDTVIKVVDSDSDDDARGQKEKERYEDRPTKMKKKPGRKTKETATKLVESDSDMDQKEKVDSEDYAVKVRKKLGRKSTKAVGSDLDEDDNGSLKSLSRTLPDEEQRVKDEQEEDDSDHGPDSGPNLVLQYLESEREAKKMKKRGRPPKDKDGKSIKKDSKRPDSFVEKEEMKRLEKRTLTINLDDPDFAEKSKEELKRGASVERSIEVQPMKNVSKPSFEEKLATNDTDIEQTESTIIEENKMDVDVELKTGASKKKKKKKSTVEETSDSEKVDDSDRNEAKGDGKEISNKDKGAFDIVDAFSVQLQESDQAFSDLMMKKKEKLKKQKQQQSVKPAQDKHTPLLPPSTSSTGSTGSSVLEMLTQEMERTVSVSSDPKSNVTYESTLKDVHSQFGLEAPKFPITESEKPEKPHCSPEMVEFLKIKVNFELDEISLKDIERHHEMGEPPCRLEKDITNAEFRQYIRQNNFEMVHEALKSKKMMYNLEHTDAMWMTQLMVAAYDGHDEIVKILAHHGARVNARTKNGSTALIISADKGRDIVCRILIAYGAYINLATTSGETALMKAAKHGHTMIVRYLLQAGADPTLKSAHGTTALENAEKGNHLPLMSLIKDHETNITAHVNECIHRECHSLGIKTIGLPILATRLYNIRETPMLHITFNCVMQNMPPNQGLMLFVVHGMIGSGLSIKCRMRGPCFVQAVTLNNFVMDPMMPGKQTSDDYTHFITNLIWRTGQNSLKLFVSQDALSSEKLFICVFQCGFVD